MNNQPIGVFDSGVGGLTVLKFLQEILPNESYIYIADQLNVPYGTKTDDELKTYITNITKYFVKQNVKAIVIACNTASLFMDVVKENANVPVFNVIEPAYKKAMDESLAKSIGIFATNLTIKKAKYQSLINENGGNSIGVGCSEFVEFIEKGDTSSKELANVVKEKASYIKDKVDTLILGCTHFGLISNLIKEELPNVKLIDSSKTVTYDVFDYLKNHDMLSNIGNTLIYTTGDANYSAKVCQKIFKEDIPFQNIKL